jgi:hypothetical protein
MLKQIALDPQIVKFLFYCLNYDFQLVAKFERVRKRSEYRRMKDQELTLRILTRGLLIHLLEFSSCD